MGMKVVKHVEETANHITERWEAPDVTAKRFYKEPSGRIPGHDRTNRDYDNDG
jgi:hypothetical protein